MRYARVALPFALVFVAFFLVQPYIFHDGLPLTADGTLHFQRILLWRWAWQDGVWWPRWHTLLARGYGYPLFTFAPPLFYAAGAALQALFSPVWALKILIVMACLAYAFGMYNWAREHLSADAAFVAAAAYVLAPYRFRELYVQGNYPQFLAWSLFPWVVLTWRRLVIQGDRRTLWPLPLRVGFFWLATT